MKLNHSQEKMVATIKKSHQAYLKDCSQEWPGRSAFSMYLEHYLSSRPVVSTEYDFVHIEQYLAKIALDAWEEFRTSDSPEAKAARVRFNNAHNHDFIPDIQKCCDNSGFEASFRHITVYYLKHFINSLAPKMKQGDKLENICQAEYSVIEGRGAKFIRDVYKPIVYPILEASDNRAHKIMLGENIFSTYSLAGRLGLNFVSVNEVPGVMYGPDGVSHPIGNIPEKSVGLICEDGDYHANSWGVAYISTDFISAVKLMDDITSAFPRNLEEAKKVFIATE